ncbi:MAG: hypothetical protein CMN31_18565 [Sandaracinus sp.]|nr:hypothetical protein [Sandaracinus sp.]
MSATASEGPAEERPASVAPGKAVDAKHRWLSDGLAGVSVALVAIPQSLAYADLAGLPPHHGLYASALPPLCAAFFASSPYLQTGPSALTALLSFAALSTLAPVGSAQFVALAALLALLVGVLRGVIGLLKGGAVSYMMSQPVLRGFATAAAVLIFASQLPKVLGVSVEGEGVMVRALAAFSDPSAWEVEALALAGGTLVLMLGGRRLHTLFPGVLVALLGGIAYTSLAGYEGAVVGEVPSTILPPFSLDLPWARLPRLLVAGAIIALVGFSEAASVSQVFAEQSRRPWDPNREFISQGVANLAAGVAGGFPVGGSFSRSALNRAAGAQTRWAGAVTGVAVLACLPFAGLLARLPMAVLGAIVLGAVLKLLDPRPLMRFWKLSKLQALVGYATFGLTLWLAPHVEHAVLAGIALALGVHAWREQRFHVEAGLQDETLVLRPMGVVWFASAPLFRQALARELAAHPGARDVRIELGAVGRVDLTGALMLQEVVDRGAEVGLEVQLDDVPPHARRILGRVCAESVCEGAVGTGEGERESEAAKSEESAP